MKTRNENRIAQKQINELITGECFTVKRSKTQENGIYIKVDKRSGIMADRFVRDPEYLLALNLETGQLRKFSYDVKVTPLTEAEVVY